MFSCIDSFVQSDAPEQRERINNLLAVNKSMSCVDISSAVEEWARDYFRRKASKRERRLLETDRVMIDIDWRRVRFQHDPPVFDPEPPKPGTGRLTHNVLFHTSFSNKTDHQQSYTFKAERATRSECRVEIEQGYSRGFEVEMQLTTPSSIMEANAGFHSEMTISKVEGETIEEELLWGVNSEIMVKPKHKAIAKLIINEEQYKGKFTIRSRAKGRIRAIFTNIKDNNSFIRAIEGDIDEIVRWLREQKILEGQAIINDGSTRSAICTTIGSCSFKYGLAQDVEVDQMPLTP